MKLQTATRLGLNLTIVIIRDDGFGMIKWKQEAMKLPSFGLDFKNPDFVQLARAFGAQGSRIERTEDFLPTLKRCIEAGGVQVIDVPVDYEENYLFTRELEG